MRILVTGGAGYVGYSLINRLEENDQVSEVVVFDNLSRGDSNFFFGTNNLKKTTFVKGDILNFDKLEKILQEIDVVYHLAAHTPFPKNHLDNLRYEQINQWGTLNLVNAIKKKSGIKKVVFLSTSSIYGNKHNIGLNDIPHPQNSYSLSKYEAEKYIRTLSESLSIHILRSGNVFGYNPCFRMDAVINNFIFKGIVYNKIQIFGDGEQMRPFVNVESLSKILEESMKDFSDIDKTENVVDFNASINDIKNSLIENLPDTEYIYLNKNLSYDSHSFDRSIIPDDNKEALLTKTIDDFNNNLRF